MAISEDTAALVAAQLTGAWMDVTKQRQGTLNMSDTQLIEAITGTYDRIKTKISSAKPAGYDIKNV